MRNITKDNYQYGFHKPETADFKTPKGLSRQVVEAISHYKNEPDWMRQFRLQSLMIFEQKMVPTWGADLSHISFDDLYYYISPSDKKFRRWADVPKDIKDTYDAIGIPQAEREYLAGVGAQYDSEMVYHNLKAGWEKQGVIFEGTDTALQKYPDLFKQYFGTVIPPSDNKFSALNSAVWSGGSFVYVPKGVKVDIPLQAYFRINAANMGQFERTLIIAEEGGSVHYVEGCFLAGAQVLTSSGEKPIEEVRIGDQVLTHKGRYRKVNKLFKRPYSKKVFTIKYYGDSQAELQVTGEHPLLVSKRQKSEYRNTSFKLQWVRADQVRKDDYLVYPIFQDKTGSGSDLPAVNLTIPIGHGRHSPTYHTLSFDLDPDFYRLVGYFLSEGHVDKEHYLSFTFNEKEQPLVQDVKSLIKRYFSKDPIIGKIRNHGQILTLCSTLAARFFAREFGSTNRTKRIPLWMLNSSPEKLAQLVNGMWSGDGSFDPQANLFRYSSVTRSLIHGFRDALLRLGITCSINSQRRLMPKQMMHNVIISRTCNRQFGSIVGKTVPNGRKEGSPFHLDANYLYVPIKSVHIKEKNTTVYNFGVTEDESYVAEGVVSHNCTAPIYSTDSLHAAVVEIVVRPGARVRYTTIQNWSTNVYNLVTKRMRVEEGGVGEWEDCNLGSKVTMKYPSVYLVGRKAKGDILSIAFASRNQVQDAGGKALHFAPETSSSIISKSISKNGGRTSFRGLLKVFPGAKASKSMVRCDALILDSLSRSDTYPTIQIDEKQVSIGHEAVVSKIGDEQLFYLMSRGLNETQAMGMVVNGFIEPIVKEIPLEYALEMNKLIQLQMEGVG